jgi:hypothetical protein
VSVEYGPDLDGGAGPGFLEQVLGDGKCPVEVVGLDQDQAGEVLLAVDERPVGQQRPAVVAQRRGRLGGVQASPAGDARSSSVARAPGIGRVARSVSSGGA